MPGTRLNHPKNHPKNHPLPGVRDPPAGSEVARDQAPFLPRGTGPSPCRRNDRPQDEDRVRPGSHIHGDQLPIRLHARVWAVPPAPCGCAVAAGVPNPEDCGACVLGAVPAPGVICFCRIAVLTNWPCGVLGGKLHRHFL